MYNQEWLCEALAGVLDARFFIIDETEGFLSEDGGGGREPLGMGPFGDVEFVSSVTSFDEALDVIDGRIVAVVCRLIIEGFIPSIEFIFEKEGAKKRVALIVDEDLNNSPYNLNPSKWFYHWGDVDKFVISYLYKIDKN